MGEKWFFFTLIYSFTQKFWFCSVYAICYHNLLLWDSEFCPLHLESKQTDWNGALFSALALSVLLHYSSWAQLSQEMSHGCVIWLSYFWATSFPERNTNCPWRSWTKGNSEIWRNHLSHQHFTGNTSWKSSICLRWRTLVFSRVSFFSWDFLLNLCSDILDHFFQYFVHFHSLNSDFNYL